jgi:molybdopterin converting factor small subunit
MKVTVEFLSLPKITRIIGSKSVSVNFSGTTIIDLFNEITDQYGEELKEFLFDKSGNLDTVFKVMLNKKQWIPGDKLDTPLQEGDRVTLMMLVGGG